MSAPKLSPPHLRFLSFLRFVSSLLGCFWQIRFSPTMSVPIAIASLTLIFNLILVLHFTECVPLRTKRAFSYIANETACTVDHIVYRDGDPIPTDDPCETCRCRPPGFSCVLRECEVKTGCRAIRRIGECCPQYQCGCEHDGKYYRDGDRIPNAESPCYSCYCQGSSITCSLADCMFRFDCEPEYAPDKCCPQYDHCPPEEPLNFVTVKSTEIPRLTTAFMANHSNVTSNTPSPTTVSLITEASSSISQQSANHTKDTELPSSTTPSKVDSAVAESATTIGTDIVDHGRNSTLTSDISSSTSSPTEANITNVDNLTINASVAIIDGSTTTEKWPLPLDGDPPQVANTSILNNDSSETSAESSAVPSATTISPFTTTRLPFNLQTEGNFDLSIDNKSREPLSEVNITVETATTTSAIDQSITERPITDTDASLPTTVSALLNSESITTVKSVETIDTITTTAISREENIKVNGANDGSEEIIFTTERSTDKVSASESTTPQGDNLDSVGLENVTLGLGTDLSTIETSTPVIHDSALQVNITTTAIPLLSSVFSNITEAITSAIEMTLGPDNSSATNSMATLARNQSTTPQSIDDLFVNSTEVSLVDLNKELPSLRVDGEETSDKQMTTTESVLFVSLTEQPTLISESETLTTTNVRVTTESPADVGGEAISS